MNTTSVACVMLTRNRPELAAKAIECFRAQTYENKHLVLLNSGAPIEAFGIAQCLTDPKPIGALRNQANMLTQADILCHWDDDDWSHPNRIAEQVAHLKTSRAEIVGYNEMLFWRRVVIDEAVVDYEAWNYANPSRSYALGTSLMYWRDTWTARMFNGRLPMNSASTGEDTEFIKGRRVSAVSSIYEPDGPCRHVDHQPRMVARIHGENSAAYDLKEGVSWHRVPEWDEKVREILG